MSVIELLLVFLVGCVAAASLLIFLLSYVVKGGDKILAGMFGFGRKEENGDL